MGRPRTLSEINAETRTGTCVRHGARTHLYWSKRPKLKAGGAWVCSKCVIDSDKRTNICPHGLTSVQGRRVASRIGYCEICFKPATETTDHRSGGLHIDHRKGTGFPRGVLCAHCNNSLLPSLELMYDREGQLHTDLLFHIEEKYGFDEVKAAVQYLSRDVTDFHNKITDIWSTE